MDTKKYMVVAKGEICTSKVISCKLSPDGRNYNITFDNGKQYSYAFNNVIFMNSPQVLNPKDYFIVSPEGKLLFDVREIYQFEKYGKVYWNLVFENFEHAYEKSKLSISKNCLIEKKSKNTFAYLSDISELSEIPNDKGEIVLKKRYMSIVFVKDDTALSKYLDNTKKLEHYKVKDVIFPFGCNQSQYKAVKNALENQISVIQGPPGTGKTQTILNIIANLLINNKTVLMVSNNNQATLNVLEKLSKEKYGMDFLVASLGNFDNKAAFICNQNGKYPDLSKWDKKEGEFASLDDITNLSDALQTKYQLQEEIARLKEEKYKIEIEAKHFNEFADETAALYKTIKVRNKLSSRKVMRLWQELQSKVSRTVKLSLLFKLRSCLLYGIANWEFYKQDLSKIVTVLQGLYYDSSIREYESKLNEKEIELANIKENCEKELEENSLIYLKNKLAHEYDWKNDRRKFKEEDLYRDSESILKEYPIVLSTTFSSRSSLNMDDVTFDYVIMDEASQVDLATGALALSCARNAVIVGDLKQLPNVISKDTLQKADFIREKYDISDAYDFGRNSFLKSVVDAIPAVPNTLLKEHYRCHPRIISFCNQKFYDNELIIMTEDDNSNNALMAIKTAEGNHARGNYNQRQIDVIKNEVLPILNCSLDDIGVITPYNEQVDAISKQIPGIDASTVHKYQGREKNVIILSTVDDQIKDFTDNPSLLNVAVSRAKKQLIVIVSGNKQDKKGNINDLVSYIQYNQMQVINSQIYSVFDYLYSQYWEKRKEYLRKKKRISEYDSENLTYSLLEDILIDYPDYGIVCHEPLSMVIRDLSGLSDNEVKYVMNPATHIDFIIYNKLSKQPVLAVETDGYDYHKEGTAQHERDIMKNHILEVCGLPLLRLLTNGCDERSKIKEALEL